MGMEPTPNQIQYRINKAKDRKAKAVADAKKETAYIAELTVALKAGKAEVVTKAAAKVAAKVAAKQAKVKAVKQPAAKKAATKKSKAKS